jgi:hypothetical protein
MPTINSQAAATADATAGDNRRVCRQRDTMGTRLRAVRVCRTQAEWRALDNAGRQRAKTMTDRPTAGTPEDRMGGG